MPTRPMRQDDQAGVLAGPRRVKNLGDESCSSSRPDGQRSGRRAWTALRLTRLQLANGLERYATRFEVRDKKSGAAVARRERDLALAHEDGEQESITRPQIGE